MTRLLAVALLLCVPAGAGEIKPPTPVRMAAIPVQQPAPRLTGHVLLYLPFEGSAEAAVARGDKLPVEAKGLLYEAGNQGQGVALREGARLAYRRAGNFDPRAGTLMLWVKRGAGSDTLFTAGKEWYGRDFFTFRIVEGQKNTHAALKRDGKTIGTVDLREVPSAGEWHHYALTWGAGRLTLYVDGKERARTALDGEPAHEALADTLWVGSGPNGIYPANSLLDELMILDVPLTPAQVAEAAGAKPTPASPAVKPAPAAPPEPVALRRLFHLDFDQADPFRAREAAGDPSPAANQQIRVVNGLRGKGGLFQGKAILAYREAGNLDKSAGSIAFWFKPVVDLTRAAGYPCFFKEDAPLGPLPVNNLWLWVDQGMLRYDLRVDPRDTTSASLDTGMEGIWHHLVVTWDCARGSRIFVDGLKRPYLVSDRPFGVREMAWPPVAHPRFFVGSRGEDTYHTKEPLWGACESVLDEVSIYNRPLSPAEVDRAYREALGVQGVPPLALLRQMAGIEGKSYRPVVDLKNRFAFPIRGRLALSLRSPAGTKPLFSQEIDLRPQATTTVEGKPLLLAPGVYRVLVAYGGRRIAQQTLTILRRLPAPRDAGAPTLVGRYDALEMRRLGENYRESASAAARALDGTPYLEVGEARFSRVAFRFSVRHPGRPHLVKVVYPDDRERVFDIVINSPKFPCTYDTQGGVLAGRELENTRRYQTYEMLYWPRETEQALLLMTWGEGMPAAIRGFEVYELDPALPPTRPAEAREGGRLLGLYWEDPMLSQCFGGRPNERDPERFVGETLDRMVSYLRWIGMNALVYPIFFYQGPGFPTLAENLLTGSGANRHPDGYVDMILERFEEQGLAFIPEINMCLSASMLLPVEQYRGRLEEGYLAVSNKGEVNVGEYPRLNVLHPLYQERLAALVAETCRRFARSRAFRGIQLHLVYESPFWLGDTRWGYDGCTIRQFEADTGIKLPEFPEGNLYQQRCEWLMREHREEWLDWRCAKVARFYERLAGILSATRRDLKLILGLRYIAEGSSYLPHWEREGRSMRAVYRGAGLDLARVCRIPNLEVQKYFFSADVKQRRTSQKGNAMYAGLELRRSDELRDTLTLGGTRPVSTNIYVNYFESDVDARQPIPGLWWEGPRWRVCGLSPGGRGFLELFAESVATFDSPMVTTGGFVVGTMGNGAQTAEFAKAYRALPAVAFTTIPGTSDTAVVRWGAGGTLYAVSRSPFPLAVKLRCRRPARLEDLSGGAVLQGEEVAIALEPYALRAFRTDLGKEDLAVSGYGLPAERSDAILRTAAALREKGPAGAALAERVERECRALNYVKCKYLLEEAAALDLQ